MKPITVMHVLHSLDIGGLETGVVNVIKTLNPISFRHVICCISQSGKNAQKLQGMNIDIFEMNKIDGKGFWLPAKLAVLFKSISADIVHTRNWGAIDGIVGAKLAGVPFIVHGEHGREVTDPDGINKKRNLIRKILSRFIDRYITVSKDLTEWLIREVGITEKKVETICNGVDTLLFNPDNKHLVRAEHGYGPQDLIIGTVGRLDPIKNQQLLIKSFASLARRYNHLNLLLIGDGPSRYDLKKLVAKLGLDEAVQFFGLQLDVHNLLKLVDIFVLPSLYEGISNTILEAMAVGIPVIASRVGGNPELVIDGVTGYLVPKHDKSSLTTTMEKYIQDRDLMRCHGAAARRKAVGKFSLREMAAGYEKIYTQLVDGK